MIEFLNIDIVEREFSFPDMQKKKKKKKKMSVLAY
jgi:hypothetical protein